MKRAWIGAALLVAIGTASWAQDHPNHRRGTEAPTAYSLGEIDSVNAFNGNLSLTVPLGLTYPVGPSLANAFVAHYNSTVWEFGAGPGFIPGTEEQTTIAGPDYFSNAGLGWQLSFGRLFAPGQGPWNPETDGPLLVEPDGTRRKLLECLHPHPSDCGTQGSDGILHSTDGSYLRLKVVSGLRVVEYPDGTTRKFDAAGYPTEIRDPFGNRIEIAYNANRTLWTISEKDWNGAQIRQHTVTLEVKPNMWLPQVTKIEMAKFGGGGAVYTFTYLEDSPGVLATIDRHSKHTDDLRVGGSPPPVSQSIQLPLLAKIEFPGNPGAQGNLAFEMTYYDTEPVGGGNCGTGGTPCNESGLVSSLLVPTKGLYEWQYTKYAFTAPMTPPQDGPQYSDSEGVYTKTVSSSVSDTPTGTWTYQQGARPNGTVPSQFHRERRTWITDPQGNVTVAYFYTEDGNWKHGLPFTSQISRNDNPGAVVEFLSKQVFHGSPTTSTTPKREEYVRYTADRSNSWNRGRANQRLQRHVTYFLDDAANYSRWTRSVSSSFDGFGHYRVQTSTSSLDATGTRIERTEFNPGSGTYDYDANSGTYGPEHSAPVPWPTADAWVIGTFTYRQQQQGGVTARQNYSFDASNGFLKSVRSLRQGTTPDPNRYDTFVLYCRIGGGGFTTSELHYGGWGGSYQVPSTLPNCNSSVPSSGWQYRSDHTYTSGTRESSRYRDPSSGNPMPFFSYEADIDASTGLPLNEYDISGYRTKLTYDALGRILTIEPRGPAGTGVSEAGAMTSYTYPSAGGASGARVEVTVECPTGSGTGCSGVEYAYREYVFDGFGRVKIERKRSFNGAEVRRDFRYNALGWKTRVYEWDDDGTSEADHWTSYSNFDAFGRPGTITPPDGSAHNVTLAYTGVRKVERTSKVHTTLGGSSETNSTTTETYDRFGRLVEVNEPSPGIPTTTYTYDVGGRLASVTQEAAATTQTRTFTYDNRGLLLSETHPEFDGGLNSYTQYDARGHARRMLSGSASRELRFDFDGAERLTMVFNVTGNSTLKEWIFEDNPASAELGKLKTATRLNPLGGNGGSWTVTENFSYGSYGRRLVRKTTTLLHNGGNAGCFDQGWAYDRAGSVTGLTYPTRYAGACPGSPAGGTPLAMAYHNGFLTSVGGWTTGGGGPNGGITYHPSGTVFKVHRTNGVTDTIARDPNDIPRPLSISTAGVQGGQNWSTGNYLYDGSGNIEKMGASDLFAYDLVSRLKQSQLSVEGATKTQSYAFDAFGNIQSITTNGTTIQSPTTSATNRLTSATYGAAGNLLNWNGWSYTYDFLNKLRRVTNGLEDAYSVYNADDERIVLLEWVCGVQACNFQKAETVRDVDGRVLRRFFHPADGAPSSFGDAAEGGQEQVVLATDYVYRGSRLLGTGVVNAPDRHFHTDHLGSARLITDQTGTKVALHTYYPFGQEASSTAQDDERLKFTGHERDFMSSTYAQEDDLDYMHKRHFGLITGRFLQVDPELGQPSSPQSWNRFAYVIGNPLRYTDPTGMMPASQQGLNAIAGGGLGSMFFGTLTFPSALGQPAGPPNMLERLRNFAFSHQVIAPTEPLGGAAVATQAYAEGTSVVIEFSDGSRQIRAGGTRAWRNNNPGNLRNSSFSRRHGSLGEAGGFAVFDAEATGQAALEGLLGTNTYQNLTIDNAIARFAPANENNTRAYQAQVRSTLGMAGSTPMRQLSATQVHQMSRVIRAIEGWRPGTVTNEP